MNENTFLNVTLDPGRAPALFIRAANAADMKAALEDVAANGLYEAITEAHAAMKAAQPERPPLEPVFR